MGDAIHYNVNGVHSYANVYVPEGFEARQPMAGGVACRVFVSLFLLGRAHVVWL